MTKDEALRMAIEALEEAREQLGGLPQLEKLIQDCKEALEQTANNEQHKTFMDEMKYGQSVMLEGKHVPLEQVRLTTHYRTQTEILNETLLDNACRGR